MRLIPLRTAFALVFVPAFLFAPGAGALPPGSTPRELEMGADASRDIAKSVRFVEDEEKLAKLAAMLREIAAATERPDIEYRPHIILSPLVNAFVIPGGYVYVTTALLDDVESDDELAGVLAHEIAHNVQQHAIRRIREAPKGLGLLQLASIAALILGKSPEAAVLAGTAANTVTAAVLNGHTIEMEKEADSEGIRYLARTQYNPTGFLTFLEKLAASSGKFIEEELGIYRTHPFTRERVQSAEDRLRDLGVPVLRRLVTAASVPRARPLVVDGETVTEIAYGEERLLLLAGHDEQRSAEAIETITWALDHELESTQMKVIPDLRGVVFAPGDGPTLFLGTEDGRVNGAGEAVLAGGLRERLAALVAGERARIRANAQMH
ncbi:MAG: M48 family metalloprotease [Candidatus Eiseniibacteriota bacterium]